MKRSQTKGANGQLLTNVASNCKQMNFFDILDGCSQQESSESIRAEIVCINSIRIKKESESHYRRALTVLSKYGL